MSNTINEETKELIQNTVRETIQRVISESSAKTKVEEEKEEDKGREDGDDEETDDDDEEEDEESDRSGSDDEELEEALDVYANFPRTSGRIKGEQIKVKDMRELTKLAKTGKYEYFTVTRRNGQEEEYMVEKGKLVLM